MAIRLMQNLTWGLLLFSFLLSSLMCIWLMNPKTGQPQRAYVKDDSVSLQTTRRLEQMRMAYTERLASFPAPEFKDSRSFIEFGPPLSSLLNVDGTKDKNTKASKLILLWTTFYGTVQWIPKKLLCNHGRTQCDVSTSKTDLSMSDAIVMHPININWTQLPKQRLPNQRWIYFSQEPPYISDKHFDKYNGLINWTSTYRWDSEFPAIFYNTSMLKEPLSETTFENEISNILKSKYKLVAIMNSNCNPQSNRFKLVEELRRYVPVDFYGRCGNLRCPRYTQECKDTMSAYKFYLSFENSHCRDYITEKVHFPLTEWKAVPIVLGAHNDDYKKIMPPNSYIHTNGFNSMESLAEYIKLLDDNAEEYKKFHAWRRTHSAITNHTTYCDMCTALHNSSLPVQIYRDFKGWYEQDTCRSEH